MDSDFPLYARVKKIEILLNRVVRPSSRVSLKGKRGSVTYPKPLAIGAFLRVDVWLLVAHHTTALLLYQRKYIQ
jgi:hypothetical protein